MGHDIANPLKSWHLLGPVTRFQSRNTPVIYEIAQVTLIVENRGPEYEGAGPEGIIVYAQDEVGLCFTNINTPRC